MKMKYEKPLAAVDYYELTQSIAGCTVKVNYVDSGCFLSSPDVTDEMKGQAAIGLFVEGACLIFNFPGNNGDGANDGICQHTNVNTIFKS